MPRPLNTRKPPHAALNKTLCPGLELPLGQAEVVDGTNTQDAGPGVAGRHTVHEGAAGRAEVICHLVARGDRLGLAPATEVFLAAQVLEVLVVDSEVGCEHGRCDLAAVCAVAHECVDETWALGRLCLALANVCDARLRCLEHYAGRGLGFRLTNDNWTAPQKQVAVASSSVDQPSSATVSGKLDLV